MALSVFSSISHRSSPMRCQINRNKIITANQKRESARLTSVNHHLPRQKAFSSEMSCHASRRRFTLNTYWWRGIGKKNKKSQPICHCAEKRGLNGIHQLLEKKPSDEHFTHLNILSAGKHKPIGVWGLVGGLGRGNRWNNQSIHTTEFNNLTRTAGEVGHQHTNDSGWKESYCSDDPRFTQTPQICTFANFL